MHRQPKTPTEKSNWTGFAGKLLVLIVSTFVYLAALGIWVYDCIFFMSWLDPVIELFVHPAFHVAIVAMAVLLCVPLLPKSRWRWMPITGILVLLTVVQPWRLLPYHDWVTPADSAHKIKVLSWNVLATNQHYDEIEKVLLESDPDVLLLLEVRPGLLDYFPFLDEKYSQKLVRTSWGGSGIAMFSRVAGTEMRFEDFALPSQPGIVASIPIGGEEPLSLIGLHTLSPMPPERAVFRDLQLAAVIKRMSSVSSPICLTGDLNTTPWSRGFRQLLEAGFADSRMGCGNLASWPAPLGIWGIPIDHALTRGACTITNRRVLTVGPGSDHRPIEFYLNY